MVFNVTLFQNSARLFIRATSRYYINPNPKRADSETHRKDEIDFSRRRSSRWRRPTYPRLHFTPVVYRHLLFIQAPVSRNRVTNFFNKVSNESVTRAIVSCYSFSQSYTSNYYRRTLHTPGVWRYTCILESLMCVNWTNTNYIW